MDNTNIFYYLNFSANYPNYYLLTYILSPSIISKLSPYPEN